MQKGMFYGANQHQTRYGNISKFSLHAEMHALKRYLAIIFGTSSFKTKNMVKKNNGVIYVVRILNSKKNLPTSQKSWLGNSKPCIHCQSYLAKYGIKKIKYTNIINGVNVLCEMKLKN